MNFLRFTVFITGAVCVFGQAPAPNVAPANPPARVVITPATPAVTPPVAPDKVVLAVGDEKVTAAEFEQLVDALPEQFRATARGPNKRQFAEQLVRIKLMSQEAHKRKLDENAAVQRQIALQKENLLANALFQDMAANTKVDDAAARQYFDQHKAEYESVHARHILLRVKGSSLPAQPGKKELTEEEALAKAQEIRKKLVAGEDFAALAKAESDDTVSAANGGDLGTFRKGQMVPQFEQAALTLPVGQLSEPIKTPFGYHLIRVEQRDAKTFEEVRPDLEKKMRPELARNAVENLRKQAPVTIDDAFFGPAAAPAPPATIVPATPPAK
ncbi:MAG: PpiC-type peptidyl-prolyl cis-trans isomerase [Bryobacterales bacterium]|nr:PpiC-type peptidyl-prolyl cis-trans isomerase [Bryobacterales bacterium]